MAPTATPPRGDANVRGPWRGVAPRSLRIGSVRRVHDADCSRNLRPGVVVRGNGSGDAARATSPNCRTPVVDCRPARRSVRRPVKTKASSPGTWGAWGTASGRPSTLPRRSADLVRSTRVGGPAVWRVLISRTRRGCRRRACAAHRATAGSAPPGSRWPGRVGRGRRSARPQSRGEVVEPAIHGDGVHVQTGPTPRSGS
jgi:hypothetical protein